MFLVTHAAVGAIIGEATGSPWLAAIGSFVAHFLADMIPHGDLETYKRYKRGEGVKNAMAQSVVDGIVTTIFILFLFKLRDFRYSDSVSMGITFGVLPDLLVGLYETGKFPWLKRFHKIHFFFHNFVIDRKRDVSYRLGLVLQLVVLIFLQFKVF